MLIQTYSSLVSVPSTSKQEDEVKKMLYALLPDHKLIEDSYGNIIIDLPGSEKPLLLNAHLDRVAPGLANEPVIRGDIVYSDGKTNSGADDAVGVSIIIELLKKLKGQDHRSLRIIFTVEEEIGLFGARNIDQKFLDDITEGIVLDNAIGYDIHPEGGVIIDKGASFHTLDISLHGKGGHPAKDIENMTNVLKIFQSIDFKIGKNDNDSIRINIGSMQMNKESTRNQVPDNLKAWGEIRSFLSNEEMKVFLNEYVEGIKDKVAKIGGIVDISYKKLAESYQVDHNESLVKEYQKAHGSSLTAHSTFVGSDCHVFRERGIKTFMISTGVKNEHSVDEEFSIRYAEKIEEDLYKLTT